MYLRNPNKIPLTQKKPNIDGSIPLKCTAFERNSNNSVPLAYSFTSVK